MPVGFELDISPRFSRARRGERERSFYAWPKRSRLTLERGYWDDPLLIDSVGEEN